MRKWILTVLAFSLPGILTVADAAKPPGAGGGGTGGGGSGTDGYVGQNLGALPGDRQSDAWDVNAQGRVVGRSYGSPMHAFYWDGTMHQLLQSDTAAAEQPRNVAWDVEAMVISSGSTEIVAGYESRQVCTPDCVYYSYPIVWDSGSLGGTPTAHRLAGGGGSANGINDAGTVIVGAPSSPPSAGAIWRGPTWTREDIPLSAFQCQGCSYDWGLADDVNNQGIAVGLVSRAGDYSQFAYVYDMQNKVGTLLPIPDGYLQSDAYAVSNAVGGVVYIAGVLRTCSNGSCQNNRGIRWTVDVSQIGTVGYVAGYEILDQLAWAQGTSDQGFIAGTKNTTPDRRGNIIQTAMLWKESVGYIPLKPPKGGSDSASRSMAVASDGTIFVVGEANASGSWIAARWVVK